MLCKRHTARLSIAGTEQEIAHWGNLQSSSASASKATLLHQGPEVVLLGRCSKRGTVLLDTKTLTRLYDVTRLTTVFSI